jgi:hypothetical protein
MTNPNPDLSKTINQTLQTYFKKFERDYPESIGMAKRMQGENAMKAEFVRILQQCPTQYLQNKEFRSAIQNADGLEDISRIEYSFAVHDIFVALGLEF